MEEKEVGFDASNLHLRKELTQIKKAAKRVLRDPGTTTSWRSPLNSARSAMQGSNSSRHNFYHDHSIDFHQFNNTKVPTKEFNGFSTENNHDDGNNINNGDVKIREKDKKVYLCNWKMQRSGSEKSRQVDDVVNGNDKGSSWSVENSLNDARIGGNDSKSDTYVGERYGSMLLNCKDTSFTPSIRRSAKKRSKRSGHANIGLNNYNNNKVKKGVLESLPVRGLEKDDLTSMVDQSDDTDDYSNFDVLKRGSLASPLLARLTNMNRERLSTKLLRDSRKDDSSYTYSTPALSTSSFKKYYVGKGSAVGSWVATTTSLNDADVDSDDPLDFPGREGCGISCYWSRRSTPKSRGYGSCFSPSLSDTLRRKGSSILCGRHSKYQKRRHRSSLGYGKRNFNSRNSGQGLVPLLINSVDGDGDSSMESGNNADELSTNFGELDLEAVNRLDGRSWSTSCKSRDGLELMTLNMAADEEGSPESVNNLSNKYRPIFFGDMIGQNIIIQSLLNAVLSGRIAPVYLFQGPRGTGKSSTARIFAAALNCLASEENKPCGACRGCAEYLSGKRSIREIDGSSKNAIDRIKYLLKNLPVASSSSLLRYQVFIVDECHLLSAKAWMAFLKFLQEPPPHIVFVLITTDIDNLPRTILSRCQKYIFMKIRDSDIVTRLRKIATEENLDAESDALNLIALNADGSLRDAETMLEQLSLFGKPITTSLVNELVGVVSDEKLIELLELALSSDTAETVKRARELLDSGVDPIVLMSQLASIIMDIISGTHTKVDAAQSGSLFSGGSLTNTELERLKRALKLLSDAEKQLRVSSERSTWFTATLLQLGSTTPDRSYSGSSRRQSSRATEEDLSSTYREATSLNERPLGPHMPENPSSFSQATHITLNNEKVPYIQSDGISSGAKLTQSNNNRMLSAFQKYSVDEKVVPSDSQILDNIFSRCIEKCHSKTLRRLLHTHGKLVSISQVKGVFVAYITFIDSDIKTRVERFLSSITNAFEYVLRSNVEVNIVMLPNGWTSLDNVLASPQNRNHLGSTSHINGIGVPIEFKVDAFSNMDSQQHSLKISKGSFDNSEGILPRIVDSTDGTSGLKERKSEIPVQRVESIIHEQRLETAWLQAMEKGTPSSLSRLTPGRNQILPQDSSYLHNQTESINSMDFPIQHMEDELSNELKKLKGVNGKVSHADETSKKHHLPLSPSHLHDINVAGHLNKDNMGYESGAGSRGCSGLFCWNSQKPRQRVKVKQGTPIHSHKRRKFLWVSECIKPRKSGNWRR